jgi:glycosyltransferase involved in cell wall biosynthesis
MERLTVLVVAHNEEGHILACLKSVLNQGLAPDEIVVVAHNCSDKTAESARAVSARIKVIEFSGPEGVIYARIRGFEEIDGGVVACLDADCIADTNWLRELIKPLSAPQTVLVGGAVILTGQLRAWLMSVNTFRLKPYFRALCHILGMPISEKVDVEYVWGANFACRKADYEHVGGLAPLIALRDELGLNYWAEDLYLALRMAHIGGIALAGRAVVKSYAAKLSDSEWRVRMYQQGVDRAKLIEKLKVKNK